MSSSSEWKVLVVGNAGVHRKSITLIPAVFEPRERYLVVSLFEEAKPPKKINRRERRNQLREKV